jgi:thymidylate kinase
MPGDGLPRSVGKLLAVEGPDGVGKSTLLQHLFLELRERGYSVKPFRFPPDERPREVEELYEVFTRSGDPMESQLAIVKIFNAYGPRILAALRENDIVLIDRYMMSVLVTCRALGLDLRLINEALRSAFIPPDLTIIYTGEPFHRPSGESPEKMRYQEEVARIFESKIPEYNHPVLRTTNEAAHFGGFPEYLTRLAGDILERIRLPPVKRAASQGRG